MWSPRREAYSRPPNYAQRLTSFIDRNFQLRYTRRVLGIVVISTLIYAIPLFYLVNQNYNTLSNLAFILAPNIAKHLDGEQVMFNIAIFGVILSQWILIAVFGRKMTEKIIMPLKKMRNHLNLLRAGELTLSEIRIRADDEFQDLVSTFNFYYTGAKEDTRQDLLKLLKIREAVSHPESLHTINDMINSRATKLNTDLNAITSTSALPAKSHDSHRAS